MVQLIEAPYPQSSTCSIYSFKMEATGDTKLMDLLRLSYRSVDDAEYRPMGIAFSPKEGCL